MTMLARRLPWRVVGWQLLFALSSVLAMALIPRLMLLEGASANQAVRGLLAAVGLGTVVSTAHTYWLLRRHGRLLAELGREGSQPSGDQLRELSEDAFRVTIGFFLPPGLLLVGFATVLRPPALDPTTALSVGLLGLVFMAATSLPLHVVLRGAFHRAVERAPPEILSRQVAALEDSRLLQRRTAGRLLLAVALPVAFVTLAAALIVNSHSRRAERRFREQTTATLVQAVFDLSHTTAGMADAEAIAAKHGFHLRAVDAQAPPTAAERQAHAVFVPTHYAPGGVWIHTEPSPGAVLSGASIAMVLLALMLALSLGGLYARAVSRDLALATRGIRLLGRSERDEETPLPPGRFREIRNLGLSIRQLADRFHVFARAQERAIAARERAARMRDMFFASVSHDLKSPLNAILGFTEVVRQTDDPNEDQLESLEVIDRSGRELLALIETILDAARVEAGQLELVVEDVAVHDLLGDAITKGYDLGGGRPVEIVPEFQEGVPDVRVDRTRMSRALATLIGHAIRSAERDYARMRVLPSRTGGVRIDLEVTGTRVRADELDALLHSQRSPGRSEHRGLALGLGLARAVIRVHGGSVVVADRGDKGSVLTVRLPATSDPTSARAASEPDQDSDA